MTSPVDFLPQSYGQIATPDFINSVAETVERHDATLISIGEGVMTGVEVRTTATLASVTTAEVAITNMTVTGFVRTGRRYKITARIKYQSSIAGDELIFRLRDGSVTGTLLGRETGATAMTPETTYIRLAQFSHEPVADINRTFVLTVARLVGSGTCTVIGGGTTNPTWIELRDDTPAGPITKII